MHPSPHPPVRIGVVGAGFMGRQHVALIRRHPEARLVGIADPAAASARSSAEAEYGCAVHADLDGLLAAGGVDAVVIASPNATHVAAALTALQAGVAVLVEKPIAPRFDDAGLLVAAAEAPGARLLVGHHRRHHPAIGRARDALRTGAIGRLVAFSGMWAARKDDAYFADIPWHTRPGAGVMLINLVHDLDLMRHLAGEVVEIQAMTSTTVRELDVEDSVSIGVRFASGALGSFLATDAGVSPWGWDQATEESAEFPFVPGAVAYRLTGTEGALSIPDLAHFTYATGVPPHWHSPLSRSFLPVSPRNSFAAQLDHFVDVARALADPLVTAADAARTLALVEAAARSAREGRAVAVDAGVSAAP
ncbi:Gfo/Idh/MocA family protein [Microbacterium sp. NPDC091313]